MKHGTQSDYIVSMKLIPLTQAKVALVDDEDFARQQPVQVACRTRAAAKKLHGEFALLNEVKN